MEITYYKSYAQALSAPSKVTTWIEHNLANYLKSNPEVQTDIEHILDWLVSDEAPKNMEKVSYDEAKAATDKWTKKLIKKGQHIKEASSDTEVVLDFKDGFKIMRLVGKNAYEREGYLMSHCVGSYYGSSKEIYSLRDGDNMPHCTMEKDQQIRGNGNIHPKYVDYIVKFLEHVGMTVGDSEMKNLGYVNIEPIKDDIDLDVIKKHLYADKYLLADKKDAVKNKDGSQKIDLDMLEVFPLIEDTETSIKVAFDLPLLVSTSIEFIRRKIKSGGSKVKDEEIKSGGDSSQLAGGYSSQLAGGNSSQLAGGDFSKLAGGYFSKLAGGYYSELTIGAKGIAVGDKGSKAQGKIGAAIVLVERDNDYNITCIKAAVIDGIKLKEDTWYILKKGKFVAYE